jgi:hypothetical protein
MSDLDQKIRERAYQIWEQVCATVGNLSSTS